MAWYLCDACGARVDAEAAPVECRCCHSGKLVPAEQLRSRDTDPELIAAAAAAVKQTGPGESVAEEAPTEPMGRGEEAPTDPMGRTLQGPIRSQSTLEIDESDIEVAAAEPKAPEKKKELDDYIYDAPTPTAPPLAEVPLAAIRTEELAEEDLQEVGARPAVPPARPQAAPAPAFPVQPKVIIVPRGRKGRVAFPIGDTDRTPPPSTLPPDVDEAAVAGAGPPPTRREAPLAGQTERLPDLAARRRRKLIASASGVVALGLGCMAIYLASAHRPDDNLTPVVAPVSAVDPDHRLPQPIDTGPDQPRDHWLPDSRWPDQRLARRPARVARSEGAVLGGAPMANDSGPASSPAEAKSSYREGLRNLMQGNPGEAIRLFKEALRKDPRLSLAYRGLGLAHEQQGDRQMARAAFSRYLVLQPGAEDADAIRARIERLK